MVIPQQPVLPATNRSPQQATFRAAATPPQKASPPRGRGVVWFAILLLWLVVAGLTYRLSIVAGRRKPAEDTATEPDKTNTETTPRANLSPRKPDESRGQ
jgi:hypothetical protein